MQHRQSRLAPLKRRRTASRQAARANYRHDRQFRWQDTQEKDRDPGLRVRFDTITTCTPPLHVR